MIFEILIVILLSLLAYIYKSIRRNYSYWQNLGLPCDEPQFLVGNNVGIGKTRNFTEIFQEHYNKYKNSGPFSAFYWFFKPAVVLTDPNLIKLVMVKDFSKFADRGTFINAEDDPLTGSLLNLEGNKWKHMRQKLTPTFTSAKMKIMFPIVTKIGQEFVDVFGKTVGKESVVNVSDFMARFTTDVIGSCAFGIEMSSLKDPNSKFRMMGKKALKEQRYGSLGMGFRFSFPKLARKLHMKETIPEVEDYFTNLVRETVRCREENNIQRNDFMDMLIGLKNNPLMKSETGEELTNLTFEEIAAQAVVFLIAGFETSSSTMGYILYELAQHEDIQQRAREEVNQILDKHNQEFTYECMKEMVYLEQVMAETLRMYTIVPVIGRFASEDYPVPGHPRYVIKKDMPVIIPAAAIHRDERYYPNPNVFNPDNFTPDKVTERDSVLYLPFGAGPRNCIGLRFGKMQAIVGLALLLKHFKFSVCDQTQIPLEYEKNNLFLSSQRGIDLKVTRL